MFGWLFGKTEKADEGKLETSLSLNDLLSEVEITAEDYAALKRYYMSNFNPHCWPEYGTLSCLRDCYMRTAYEKQEARKEELANDVGEFTTLDQYLSSFETKVRPKFEGDECKHKAHCIAIDKLLAELYNKLKTEYEAEYDKAVVDAKNYLEGFHYDLSIIYPAKDVAYKRTKNFAKMYLSENPYKVYAFEEYLKKNDQCNKVVPVVMAMNGDIK